MKRLKKEIKMLLAEKFLSLAASCAPDNEEGDKLKRHVYQYFIGLFS